jgi:lipopolysaccharide export system permease protein
MREIEIVDLSNPTVKRTIHADSGLMEFSEGQVDLFLILHDGYLQEIPAKDPGQFQRHFFERNRIRVRGVGNQLVRTEGGGFKSDREMTICEMQREVDQAYGELESNRETLEGLLAGQARAAVRGVDAEPEPPALIERHKSGIGLAYCRMIGALQRERRLEPERPLEDQLPSPGASGGGESGASAGPAASPMLASADESAVTLVPTQEPRRPAAVSPSGARQSIERRVRQAEIDSAGAMAQSVARNPSLPMRIPGVEDVDQRLKPTGMVAAQIESLRSQMEIARQTMHRFDVEIQKKFALAAACVVFVLLGAPVALRFPRGGVGMTLGVSLVVFAIYYVGLIGGESLADRGLLTPFWAMWAANVIFAVVGLFLLARMGREGATSRGGDFGELREQARMWLAKQGRRLGLPLERRRKAA